MGQVEPNDNQATPEEKKINSTTSKTQTAEKKEDDTYKVTEGKVAVKTTMWVEINGTIYPVYTDEKKDDASPLPVVSPFPTVPLPAGGLPTLSQMSQNGVDQVQNTLNRIPQRPAPQPRLPYPQTQIQPLQAYLPPMSPRTRELVNRVQCPTTQTPQPILPIPQMPQMQTSSIGYPSMPLPYSYAPENEEEEESSEEDEDAFVAGYPTLASGYQGHPILPPFVPILPSRVSSAVPILSIPPTGFSSAIPPSLIQPPGIALPILPSPAGPLKSLPPIPFTGRDGQTYYFVAPFETQIPSRRRILAGIINTLLSISKTVKEAIRRFDTVKIHLVPWATEQEIDSMFDELLLAFDHFNTNRTGQIWEERKACRNIMFTSLPSTPNFGNIISQIKTWAISMKISKESFLAETSGVWAFLSNSAYGSLAYLGYNFSDYPTKL